ncbi:MAG TPA: hypothetical protein VES20_02000 [Bryobacteraceae bacterium]|nr:hypothetical protein [Bryobacteraceae bacterium]
MKRFAFPFETALGYRESKADQERTRLEQLHSVRGQLEQDRTKVMHQIQLESLRSSEGIRSAEDLRILNSFVSSLRQREVELTSRVSECSQHIEAQSQRCVVADRDHKLLAQLRERRLAAWEYEADREIEQTATELWLAGFARRARGGRTEP